MKNFNKYVLLSLMTFSFCQSMQAREKSLWQIFIGIFIDSDETQPVKDKWDGPNNNSSQNYNNHPSVDYGRVRQEFRSAFDTVLATSYQSQYDQQEIKNKREKISNQVIEILQRQYGNLSEHQAKQKAHELAQSAAVEFVAQKAEQLAHVEINKLNYLPCSPEYLQNKIKEEILRQASQRVSNNYGSLREYIGHDLYRKVMFIIEKESGFYDRKTSSINYNQDPYAHLPAHQRPSAPLIEQESGTISSSGHIYEIYPQIPYKMIIFREEICCVCHEDFAEIGKRVILPCGHDICPSCCNEILYKYNNKKCPKCRRIIQDADFPKAYLSQYL